ncbi:MAG: rubrerythrin family protein [Eggerthellaceae bacterium]|jgi:rubrerythrin|nr:rubrerythrin family protein [Eggerthellaceae bacterium]MCH4221324.1 rubrerythrin family protein [Eggerthellaceae bacterium]
MAQQTQFQVPTADQSHNFNVVAGSTTNVGTTLENLKAAVAGETGANAKYETFSKAAADRGFDQASRLFAAAAAAERIHIALETKLVQAQEPDFKGPEPTPVSSEATDLDLIGAALGEIHETSDMYPSFIRRAQEEGDAAAVQVFTRAKLAEAFHAERYLDAYNQIDNPSDETYYVCPVCGYIHKGSDIGRCPVCGAMPQAFKAF